MSATVNVGSTVGIELGPSVGVYVAVITVGCREPTGVRVAAKVAVAVAVTPLGSAPASPAGSLIEPDVNRD